MKKTIAAFAASLTTLVVSTALVSTSLAQNDFDAATIVSQHVNGNVYMLMVQGVGAGNIAVSLGDDGVLMVDDQFAPLAEKIQAAIDDIGGDAPRFLMNTHWHGDHSGGNEEFSDKAIIIAQDNVRVRLSDPSSGRVPESFPVITFEDSISVHFNGEEVSATYLPNGHTDGDAMIWFKDSNVIHMGDHYFGMSFPFVDLNSGGSVVGLVNNLNTALSIIPDDAQIIPGHGELANKTQFSQYVDGVVETSQIVINKISDGLSLEQIITQGFPAQYDSWGLGFINEEAWITTIYNSVTE